MPIHILADDVSSAIAAGEVVERPAAVVKELIENSIDAGSTNIDIEVGEGGTRLIKVVDNGAAIPQDELEVAVARFTTSKLSTLEDLEAIHSLGFRGEALASIGAVSEFEIISRPKGSKMGYRIMVSAGATGHVEPASAGFGTIVTVRDLFTNVPARKEFLKSATTERRLIAEYVFRYAFAYPEIRFKLQFDDRLKFSSAGKGDPFDVLVEQFGADIAQKMLVLQRSSESPIVIAGFISDLELHRSNRSQMHFFVNGRPIKDSRLTFAAVQAYKNLLKVGRFPILVVGLAMDAAEVDVNVHPTKAEVRFRQPDLVFSTVQRSIRATLLGQATSPPFTMDEAIGSPTAGELSDNSTWRLLHPYESPGRSDWVADGHREEYSESLLAGDLPLLRPIGQIGASYLVAEGPDGLYMVDQHAAHERVLFEQLMEAVETKSLESQSLLNPELIEITPGQAELLHQNLHELNTLGFKIEHFGGTSFRVLAVPVILSDKAPRLAVLAAVEDFEEDEAPLQNEIEAMLAARICKRMAVKAGQVLSSEEQTNLLLDLEACASPRTCPHGRPTMIHVSIDSLEQQFGRR